MTAKPLTPNSTALDYLALHKELWMWLAENTNKQKQDWLKWDENGGDIKTCKANCFACEWANTFSPDTCKPCLLAWGNKLNICMNYGDGLFAQWENAPIGSQERADLALKIANLPLAERWRK